MVKEMPHNSGRNRRRGFNGGGARRRRLQCRCGWQGVRNSKRELNMAAKMHAKHCTTMQENLKNVLAADWPEFEHSNGNPLNRPDSWRSSSVQAFSSVEEDVEVCTLELVSTDSSEPSEPSQPPAGPVFPDGYLPGDSVIERRVAEHRTGDPMTEEEKEEINDEMAAYIQQKKRAERLAESIARNRGMFLFLMIQSFFIAYQIFIFVAGGAIAAATAASAEVLNDPVDEVSLLSLPTTASEGKKGKKGKKPGPPKGGKVLHCPLNCCTKTGRLMRFYAVNPLITHVMSDHPHLQMTLTFPEIVQMNAQPVSVQRHVLLLDENTAETDNGDEISVGTGSSSSSVAILLEGADSMIEVDFEDLCFNMGQLMVADDEGDSEDELDR